MSFSLLSTLFLAVFVSSTVTAQDCPPDKCAENPPTVQDGKIVMKIFYDNDDPNDLYQWNTNMVNMACDALDAFGNQLLVLDFKMGASSSRCYSTGELICKSGDCYLDRLEACASKSIGDFPKFACCNNRGFSYYKCAADQGVPAAVLDSCMEYQESDDILIGNSEERANYELPVCYLPDVLFNDRNDRCIKFHNSAQLITVLCGMYSDAGIQADACNG